jgi:hypothetical protein
MRSTEARLRALEKTRRSRPRCCCILFSHEPDCAPEAEVCPRCGLERPDQVRIWTKVIVTAAEQEGMP